MTRRIFALVLMVAGVTALAAGAFLAAGLAAALLVGGGCAVVLAVLVGWNS